MTDTHVKQWFCCLNAAEMAATVACAANAGPITYFIVKHLYDACFVLAFEGNASNRSDVYIRSMGLTLGSFPPDDPDAIEVYFLQPDIWDDINAYFDEYGTGCPDGCKIRTFPF